jgi:hypothetical protein
VILPGSKKELLKKVLDVKDACRVSAANRSALARVFNSWVQTGRADGNRAIINKLFSHTDRLAAHLYSPTELRFTMDFENHYEKPILATGEMAARVLTREWERKDIDMLFGAAVKVGVDYGSAIIKQMWGHSGIDARIVMPWQFGVYREDVNDIEEQEALVESGMMTMEEAWRRVSHLPDAEGLYRRMLAHARREPSDSVQTSFFHNVLSTAVLNTNLESARQQPGGIVQLASDPSTSQIGPEIATDMVTFHEMWVKDDDREDYTTILLIEPDIIVSPYYKRENMFAPQVQPFSLIQPNYQPGYFWGRSEVVDLIELQDALGTSMDDLKRLMGLQVDKLLAFTGSEGITDEKYQAFRTAGYVDLGPGGNVNDLTPKIPTEIFAYLQLIGKYMEEISGFGNILSGQGEPGVRAASHAEMMLKTASPRLRDRALLVERQAAAAADKSMDLLAVKDGRIYRTDPAHGPVQEFTLHDLPEDRRVAVDSHSSSPIFSDDHQQLVAFGLKAGIVDGVSAIEMLPYPNKDMLSRRFQEKQAAQAKVVQEHPELLTKGRGKQ